MQSDILRHLHHLDVDDAFRHAIVQVVEGAGAAPVWLKWREVLEQFGVALGSTAEVLKPFLDAWCLLYLVTLALDHLEDGDTLSDPWFAAQPGAVQYHLVFSTFAVAQHALSQLPTDTLPIHRLVRLYHRWLAAIPQIASGQYLDLVHSSQEVSVQATARTPLELYEKIAAQKTGATFTLGFAGVADLATDGEAIRQAAARAGLAYGLLLQYNDDLLDAAVQQEQPNTLTLERALISSHPEMAEHPARAAQHFWHHIYAQYMAYIPEIVTPLPLAAQTVIYELLNHSFGPSLISSSQQ